MSEYIPDPATVRHIERRRLIAAREHLRSAGIEAEHRYASDSRA